MKNYGIISPPILVAACGNLLAGDDAFGPQVAARLQQSDQCGMEVVDLGMKPASLLDHLEARSGLIIIDAALPIADTRLDQLIDIDLQREQPPDLVHDIALSSHGLSIAHELALARKLDLLPQRVRLIAVQALTTRVGEPVSGHLRALIEPAARRVEQIVEHWIDVD